jgi:hypothetical protein
MKDKEKLLSFETKLKFIFSHSALKESSVKNSEAIDQSE